MVSTTTNSIDHNQLFQLSSNTWWSSTIIYNESRREQRQLHQTLGGRVGILGWGGNCIEEGGARAAEEREEEQQGRPSKELLSDRGWCFVLGPSDGVCPAVLVSSIQVPWSGWMEHDPGKKKSFSAFVQRKLKIRPGTQFADEWDNIIAPAGLEIGCPISVG